MKNILDEVLFTECFSIIIKKYRRIACISQEQLAKMAGLHRTYISLIETGKKNCTLLTSKKIANALNLRLSDIVSEVEKEYLVKVTEGK